MKGPHARRKPDADETEVADRFIVAWRDLFGRAEAGESWAVHHLVWSVCYGVELLQQVARSNRPNLVDALRYFARNRETWPLMRSPHPSFDLSDKETAQILQNIQLGENLPFLLGKEARTKHDKFTEIVIDLISQVQSVARTYQVYNDPKCLFVGKRKRLPRWAKGAARLRPLRKESADLWWPYVRILFHKKFPNPNEDPTLRAIVKKKGSPGVINSAIRDQVRQKIRSLARK